MGSKQADTGSDPVQVLVLFFTQSKLACSSTTEMESKFHGSMFLSLVTTNSLETLFSLVSHLCCAVVSTKMSFS